MTAGFSIGKETPEDLDSSNSLAREDRNPHEWYRFVLSFPPHLVRYYLNNFGVEKGDTLLDPFEGTGTTVVEGKKMGLNVVGFEANPICHFASKTKLNWEVDVTRLSKAIENTSREYKLHISKKKPLPVMDESKHKLLIKNSISDKILRKCLLIKNILSDSTEPEEIKDVLMLALARTAMSESNLKFAPEVGTRSKSKWKDDSEIFRIWSDFSLQMRDDLQELQGLETENAGVSILVDSRKNPPNVPEGSIDFLFTSPPYPNEKDYTRTTRLESVLLDFYNDKKEIYHLKKGLICSNTRAIHTDDDDGDQIMHISQITDIANEIEKRRIEQNGTSGFEKLFHKVVLHFFGGMRIHLMEMKKLMKPGGILGYVVGDQTSFFRVPIRTGMLLGIVAEDVGLEVVRIDLFRERDATVLGTKIREEVVILKNPTS